VSGPVSEFWVVRVLLHPGPHKRPAKLAHMDLPAQVATLALVNTGDLGCLPDGCIFEPVEVFSDQLDAHAHREQLQADNSDEDYRVILNTNVVI
jgi:hypothetical protein